MNTGVKITGLDEIKKLLEELPEKIIDDMGI